MKRTFSKLSLSICSLVLGTTSIAHADAFFQGKTVSSANATVGMSIPGSGAPATVLSADLPSTYRSSKNFLVVTVGIQGICTGDRLGTTVSVDNHYLEPDRFGTYFIDLPTTGGYAQMTRQFVLPPVSQGGPDVTPGSQVVLKATSDSGSGCSINIAQLVIESLK